MNTTSTRVWPLLPLYYSGALVSLDGPIWKKANRYGGANMVKQKTTVLRALYLLLGVSHFEDFMIELFLGISPEYE